MKRNLVRPILVLSTLLFAVTACIPILIVNSFVVYCDRAELNYDEYYTEGGPYTLQVFRVDGTELSEPVVVDGGGFVLIPFYEKQEEDTDLYLSVNGSHYTEQFVSCSETGTRSATWFEPGDDRINRQAYAYASIYCDAANQRVGIYGIHSVGAGDRNDGTGFPGIFVPYSALPTTPTASNELIAQYQNIRFYRLTSGEYQVNVGPDFEGKEYVVIWDGCPQTYVNAYILQNGVMTQTETYPH